MSTVLTYFDVLQSVRERMGNDENLRITDDEIMDSYMPRALAQLRMERPDLYQGLYGSETFKPTDTSAFIQIPDSGFVRLVETLVALLKARPQ